MSRSIKSALAVVAIALTLGLTVGPVAVSAAHVTPTGGATGCCRTIR